MQGPQSPSAALEMGAALGMLLVNSWSFLSTPMAGAEAGAEAGAPTMMLTSTIQIGSPSLLPGKDTLCILQDTRGWNCVTVMYKQLTDCLVECLLTGTHSIMLRVDEGLSDEHATGARPAHKRNQGALRSEQVHWPALYTRD
ncbi:hypothetical protein BJX61DRAFT_293943 [Aspergillus egyptiacus]|nr:hypothetical protein BJX61DRAFT_293943 [Aspergillus egyptiacus]